MILIISDRPQSSRVENLIFISVLIEDSQNVISGFESNIFPTESDLDEHCEEYCSSQGQKI